MDKTYGRARRTARRGGGGQPQEMEGDLTGGHSGNRLKAGRYEGPSSESGAVTQARKHKKEEEELKGNLQLKDIKPVVSLETLTAEELEALLEDRRTTDIQPKTSALSFPPEILEMILDNVEDPTDLQSFSRAHPMLSNVLSPRKPVYLFDQVLPHLVEHLPFDEIKTCRLVCQEWKRGVNQLIDDRPSVHPYDDKIFLEQMGTPQTRLNFGITAHSRLQPVTRVQTDVNSLGVFTASYTSLNFEGTSPFLGGALELLVAPEGENQFLDEDIDDFFIWQYIALRNFILQFGPHLQHLTFKSLQTATPAQCGYFTYALCCLRHCPNLRTLSIQMSHARNLTPHMLGIQDHPHLHTIEISAPPGIYIPDYFINAVVTPHLNQLQKLSLPRTSNPTWLPLQYETQFLKELHLDMLTSNRDLERLRRLYAPVAKLTLKFSYPELDLATLLKVLNLLPIRHLELSWTSGESPVIRKCHSTQQALPEISSVHTLKMTNSVDVDYTFLRSFSNLQHLYIYEQVAPGVPLNSTPSKSVMNQIISSEAVQIHKYLYGGQMNRSNVWGVLPHLKVIVFERVREGEEGEKLKLSWERPPGLGQPMNHSL